MMDKIKDVLGSVGSNTASYANRIGCRTSALARTVGPKRGGIALGVLAAVIAVPFIVRAIRARREEEELGYIEEQLEPGVARRARIKQPRRRGFFRRTHAVTSTHAY